MVIARKLIFDQQGLAAFGEHLRQLRKRHRLTQKQLAFEAGISFTQIVRIEKALINPTLSTIFAIARALDVHIKDVFDFDLPAAEKG